MAWKQQEEFNKFLITPHKVTFSEHGFGASYHAMSFMPSLLKEILKSDSSRINAVLDYYKKYGEPEYKDFKF